MKKSVFLLIIILLSSAFLGAVNLTSGAIQTGSEEASSIEPNAMYTMTGEHEANDVDYVWISGVSQGDLVLLDVQIDPYSGWISVVSDSKAIPIQTSSIGGTHIHEFVAR